jgi:hypothetical protein
MVRVFDLIELCDSHLIYLLKGKHILRVAASLSSFRTEHSKLDLRSSKRLFIAGDPPIFAIATTQASMLEKVCFIQLR